jgi:hypothetical protein
MLAMVRKMRRVFEEGNLRPNQAMSLPLLLAVPTGVEQKIQDAVSSRDRNRRIFFHAYGVVTYVVSLHGTQGRLLGLEGLHKRWRKEGSSYVTITLRGSIKGEHHEHCHLIPWVPQ